MLARTTLSKICVIAALLDAMFAVAAAWAPLLEDNVSIRTDILGLPNPGPRSWADSYSDGDSCYCATTFDHNLALVLVDTPLGIMTIKDVCALLGEGPTGSRDGRPLYNDIQCGNGPSVVYDEVACPGRTEYGQGGCKYIGPKWNFTPHLPLPPPTKAPATTKKPTKAPAKAPIVTPIKTPIKAPTKASPIVVPTISTTPLNTCQIVQLNVWDTINDRVSKTNIVNGTKICNNMEFSIDAIATSACLGYNVQFIVLGPNSYRMVRNEGKPPYLMYGNTGTTIYGKQLPTLGMYTVSVIPNQRTDWMKIISFQIIGC